MRSFFSFLWLLLLSLIPLLEAEIVVEDVEAPDKTPGTTPGNGGRQNVSIEVRASFPDSAVSSVGIFYNGRTSRVDVSITNKEPSPILVEYIGGYFQDSATLKAISNLTSKAYSTYLQPNGQQTFPYSIQAFFPGPRILHLTLAVQFNLNGQIYQAMAHNGTVTIADPPQNFFDPQAWFLYIILASALAGVAYLVYSTWVKTVLPKKTKRRPSRDPKKKESVNTGTTTNYEEWIPSHHLRKENTPKKRKGAKGTASGNASS